MSRRILITGGAGFIGSHLADRLLAAGNEVIAVDNLATGHTRNIEHLAGNGKFRFIKHDVTEFIYIEGKVDVVLHLASLPSPVDYLKKPIPTLKVGAHGTHKALGLARAKNALFMLASTSEVYGDPQVHPQPEDYLGNVNPVGPRGVYDESKRFAEAITMAYHRYHGVDSRIFRIFNTYGPRMRPDDGRVVTNFINQALHGEALTIYDDGQRTRSFCYVTDLIDGIISLMDSDESDPVNLGNPGEMTILQFAEIVQRLTGGKSELKHIVPTDERTKDDPQVRRPDITKARRVLGWEPKVSLEDGLGHTIEYFQKLFAES
ncbi:MAG: UDP-glucuronic acid decarboxylase family protein [Deltaproteobacteria bacterium]